MDINNIKQTPGFGPRSDLPAETASKPKSEATFADATAKLQTLDLTPSLQSLSQCKKAALDVPEKLDAMVRACVSELVDSGQQVTGPLSKADKQSLTNFLSEDPLIRQQIESYLRKVAT
jgi:hypothetical protein